MLKLNKVSEEPTKIEKSCKETSIYKLDATDLLEPLEVLTSITKIDNNPNLVTKYRTRKGKFIELQIAPIEIGTAMSVVHLIHIYCTTSFKNNKVFSINVKSYR